MITNLEEIKEANERNRNINLIGQVLGIVDNIGADFQKIMALYDFYINCKTIPKTSTFKQSLKTSKEILVYYESIYQKLENLEKNNPSSFLIVPILGKMHCWSILIKKTDEGYNGLMINKSVFFRDNITEFVFFQHNLPNLVQSLYYSSGSHNKVEEIYKNFENMSDKKYNINISTTNQKSGNCFVKNQQAAIKLAYALCNTTWQEFANKHRIEKSDKFAKSPIGKMISAIIFGNNWGYTSENTCDIPKIALSKLFNDTVKFTNENINTQIVESIVSENVSINDEASNLLKIYLSNKKFKDLMMDNNTSEKNDLFFYKCLEYSFDNKKKTKSCTKEQNIQEMIKNISYSNFQNLLLRNDEFNNFIIRNMSKEYTSNYFKCLDVIESTNFYTKNSILDLYREKYGFVETVRRIFGKFDIKYLTLYNLVKYSDNIIRHEKNEGKSTRNILLTLNNYKKERESYFLSYIENILQNQSSNKKAFPQKDGEKFLKYYSEDLDDLAKLFPIIIDNYKKNEAGIIENHLDYFWKMNDYITVSRIIEIYENANNSLKLDPYYYIALKQFDKAEKHIEEEILHQPSFSSFYNRGCVYLHQDQIDKAKENFIEALAVYPENMYLKMMVYTFNKNINSKIINNKIEVIFEKYKEHSFQPTL